MKRAPAGAWTSHKGKHMEIGDFSKGQLWAILPDHLDILVRKFHDFHESKDLAVEAAKYSLMLSSRTEEKPYTVQDGAAVIPISGPITKRDTFFSYLFGGASVASITRSVQAALDDVEAKAIVLSVDSPGGTVGGIESLTELVKYANTAKPVVSFANSMMASAAYWFGSAARSILAENTAQVGSIGVLMVHYDFSEMDRRIGLKRTYLAAGKYKAMGNDAEPLNREAQEMIEGQLNHYYGLFVNAVAANRGVDPQAVLEKMADGRTFIGSQALEAGLIDKIGNLQAAIDTALSAAAESTKGKKSYFAGGNSPGKEFVMGQEVTIASITTVDQLTAALPELARQIRELGAKSVDAAKIKAEGATEERTRIIGLAAIQFGEEAGNKFKAVVETGVTVEQFKAISGINPAASATDAAEKAEREKMLAALQASGADNPGASKEKTTVGDKDFMTLVDEYATANKTTKTVAMQKVRAMHPKVHEAYIAKMNA